MLNVIPPCSLNWCLLHEIAEAEVLKDNRHPLSFTYFLAAVVFVLGHCDDTTLNNAPPFCAWSEQRLGYLLDTGSLREIKQT